MGKLRLDYSLILLASSYFAIAAYGAIMENDLRSSLVNMGLVLNLFSLICMKDGRPYYRALGNRLWVATALLILYTLVAVR